MLRDDEACLPGGPRLALRRVDGAGRPFLLVHGLASNARLWDGVARHLAAAGHEVVAADLRGHGRSEQTGTGYTTARAAADLAALCDVLDMTSTREPVVAGQSWGGNVVVTLAAEHGGVAGVALVDGGWIVLGERFPTFADCWSQLAPPRFEGVTRAQIEARIRQMHPDWPAEGIDATMANFADLPDGTVTSRLQREHHRAILESMYVTDPRPLYPRIRVPVLLAAAGSPGGAVGFGPEVAVELLPDATLRWYEGADHDLHAQHPGPLAADLLELAARAEGRPAEPDR